MNQAWPLRIGRFVYGLLLAMCGLGYAITSQSASGAFAIAMGCAVCGILIGNLIIHEGRRSLVNVARGTAIGWVSCFAFSLLYGWSPVASLILPPIGAFIGAIIGTDVETAKQAAVQAGLLGLYAGLMAGISYWLILLFRSGVNGNTLTEGLTKFISSLLAFTLLASFIGSLIGAIWHWQCLRPQHKTH